MGNKEEHKFITWIINLLLCPGMNPTRTQGNNKCRFATFSLFTEKQSYQTMEQRSFTLTSKWQRLNSLQSHTLLIVVWMIMCKVTEETTHIYFCNVHKHNLCLCCDWDRTNNWIISNLSFFPVPWQISPVFIVNRNIVLNNLKTIHKQLCKSNLEFELMQSLSSSQLNIFPLWRNSVSSIWDSNVRFSPLLLSLFVTLIIYIPKRPFVR